VLLSDLDLFKMKNDTYGHLVGDTVLLVVAALMRRSLRRIDLMGRYGGEEFIILLVETTPEEAMLIARRLRQLVELHPIRAYDELLRQTVSIGVACFPEDGDSLQALIDRADAALYAAKRAGRNQIMRWARTKAVTSNQ
jgi:diguanylate cyclase (GGDEF)-like protein